MRARWLLPKLAPRLDNGMHEIAHLWMRARAGLGKWSFNF
jgi:hypothetical protein